MAPEEVADQAIDLVAEGLAGAMIGDMPDLLASRAALSGDAVALEELATGRTLTYAELDARAGAGRRRCWRRAASARATGSRSSAGNASPFSRLLFGCAKLGAILVPLNWRMPPAELDGLIADCRAAAAAP